MSNVGWSDDRVSTLSKLWLNGLSASQIARQLGGVTRNAVIGKVHRLGLADRGMPMTRPRISTPRPSRPGPQVMRGRRTREAAPSVHTLPLVAEAPGLVRNQVHLDVHACKWPIGDPQSATFSFCGAQADGRYCGGHERLATRPGKASLPIDRDPVVRRALAGLI